MSVCRTEKKVQGKLEGSSYSTRTAYLQAMKQSMADDICAYHSHNDDIEEYLMYEKQVSHHIQKLLEHSDSESQ